ncbi:MAG: TolC family protein [Nitrospirae bacterium]|nr:TolC family protein [Nitrospirota bacterium]
MIPHLSDLLSRRFVPSKKRTVSVLPGMILFALFLGFGGAIASAAEPSPLSLKDVLLSARQQNEQIRISEEQVFRAEKDWNRALSEILPKLTLEGNYTRDESALFVNQSQDSYNIQGRLNQPLFKGGKLRSGLRIAKGGIEASRQARSDVRETLLFETARTFFDVLKAQETVEVEKRNLTRLEEHLRQARARFQVGDVTRAVVLRAEAESAGGEAALIMAENSLSILKERLQVLAGLPGNFSLQKPTTSFSENEPLESMAEDTLSGRATKNRPDLLRLVEEEKVAREQVRFTRGDYFPSLSLEGIYFYRGQDPESAFFIDESWSLAVRLDYPLFDGGLRRANLQQSRSSLREAQLAHTQLEKEVGADVHNALLNLRASASVLKSLNKQVAFAKENYEMVSKQFQNGLATNVDVLDANTLLSEAERDQVHAQMEKEVAYLALQKSMGMFVQSLGLEGK